MAVERYNNNSASQSFSILHRNAGGNPLQAASAAEELIKDEKVQVIIGIETWPETMLVAEIGNQAQVPVLSFASTAIAPSLLQLPFLVHMASNVTQQLRCIASIAHFFQWRRVVAIYEVDKFGGDSGMLASLAEQLHSVGSNIERHLVFPPISSLSNPKKRVCEELSKLLDMQSRVFVILQSSLSLATHLFKEAKQMGLMGQDSVWIVTDTISSQLDILDTSLISSMEGVIGIKTWFSEDNNSFIKFRRLFKKKFQSKYPEEDNSEPGIHALRAYDGISAITKAVNGLGGNDKYSSSTLLKNILSSNFTILSGGIRFQNGQLGHLPIFTIVNVIGKKYKEVGFWSSKVGFLKDLDHIEESGEGNSIKAFENLVTWPGNLRRAPKGWAMPSESKRMKIGVPGRTAFGKFVKVKSEHEPPSGFCIDVFDEVLKIVEKKYHLPHDFYIYNGTYKDLLDHVVNKTYDAVIGDVTILANRSRYMEFTQPFAESRLTMLVTARPEGEKPWMFLKPFTKELWAATGGILAYTVFIVWLLERKANPEFQGRSWRHQLGTSFWFTYSSLFFAQRETIHSKYARVVLLVWFFVALALNSSYTANLSSILTVSKLEPNVTDVGWLQRHNAKIGCDGDSFVWKYLIDVLKFKEANMVNITTEDDYPGNLSSGNITAALVELPYEKAFLMENCKGYTGIDLPDIFGGFGFVFQKGSPIAADFSEAILTLKENEMLKLLETKWFDPNRECLTKQTTSTTNSLSSRSFWGLFLFSGVTSTLCYLFFCIHGCYKSQNKIYAGDSTTSNDVSLSKQIELVNNFGKGERNKNEPW
ncbi:Glutamate receptor 2.7 like [Actinidia chinensis var. chinensis]|uniref:Glutamate receptor n=1 Tax=Actinidia chinensis var. chinensis TaxID=1590841 RepID=A0A2R6RAM4_ACTCC|nr:Glutamate receptor 2.7 like [Actinidia chinensis var. chinensis]